MRFHELFSVDLIDRRNMDVCHFEVESTEGFMNHIRKRYGEMLRDLTGVIKFD